MTEWKLSSVDFVNFPFFWDVSIRNSLRSNNFAREPRRYLDLNRRQFSSGKNWCPDEALKYAARPWSSGYCLGRMSTNHVCWSDRAPEVKQAWEPHERGIRLFNTPPSWTAGPREVPRIPDIFSWRFFLESAARTCTSVRLYISSTKSSSAILTAYSWSPPQNNYPDLKVSDRSEHFF